MAIVELYIAQVVTQRYHDAIAMNTFVMNALTSCGLDMMIAVGPVIILLMILIWSCDIRERRLNSEFMYRRDGLLCILLNQRSYSETTRRNFDMKVFPLDNSMQIPSSRLFKVCKKIIRFVSIRPLDKDLVNLS